MLGRVVFCFSFGMTKREDSCNKFIRDVVWMGNLNIMNGEEWRNNYPVARWSPQEVFDARPLHRQTSKDGRKSKIEFDKDVQILAVVSMEGIE